MAQVWTGVSKFVKFTFSGIRFRGRYHRESILFQDKQDYKILWDYYLDFFRSKILIKDHISSKKIGNLSDIEKLVSYKFKIFNDFQCCSNTLGTSSMKRLFYSNSYCVFHIKRIWYHDIWYISKSISITLFNLLVFWWWFY